MKNDKKVFSYQTINTCQSTSETNEYISEWGIEKKKKKISIDKFLVLKKETFNDKKWNNCD